MQRAGLIQQIKKYQIIFSEEQKIYDQFLEFIQNNPLCFERSLKAGHVTGSAFILNNSKTAILLTHHRKLNKWIQLGGHVDGESDILKSSLREAYEESGLKKIEPVSPDIFDLDIHEIPAYEQEPAHFHYDVRYAFQTVGDDTFRVSPESKALAWVPLEQIVKMNLEESVLRMCRKWTIGLKKLD